MRGMIRCVCKTALAVAGFAVIGAASATDSSVSGSIISVWAVTATGGAPNNYDFRVYLAGYPVFCNGQTWAYVNSTEANYATVVAIILEAKAVGSNVSLYFQEDGAGLCHISLVTVNS